MAISVKNMLGGGGSSLENIWGKYEQVITPPPKFKVTRNPNNQYGMMLSNIEGSTYDVTQLPLSFFDGYSFQNSATTTLYFTYSNGKLYYGSSKGSVGIWINTDTVSDGTRRWTPNINSVSITTDVVDFNSSQPNAVDNTFIEYVSDKSPDKYPNYALHTDGYWYQKADDVKVLNGKRNEAYALEYTISPYNFVKADGKFNGHGDIIEPWEEIRDNYYTAQGVSGVSLGGDKILFQHTRLASNGTTYIPHVTIANITDLGVEILSDTVLDEAQSYAATTFTIEIDDSRFLCAYGTNNGSYRYRVVTVDRDENTVTVSSSNVTCTGVNGYDTITKVDSETFVVFTLAASAMYYFVIDVNGDTLTRSDALTLLSISSTSYPCVVSNGDEPMLLYTVTSNYYIVAAPLKYDKQANKVTTKITPVAITSVACAYGLSACACYGNVFVVGRKTSNQTVQSGTLISFDCGIIAPLTDLTGTSSRFAGRLYPVSRKEILILYPYGSYNFYSYSVVMLSNPTITTSTRVAMTSETTNDRYSYSNFSVCGFIEGDGFFAVPSTTNASYYYLKLTRFNVNKGLVLADGNSDGLLVTKATTTEKGTYWSY